MNPSNENGSVIKTLRRHSTNGTNNINSNDENNSLLNDQSSITLSTTSSTNINSCMDNIVSNTLSSDTTPNVSVLNSYENSLTALMKSTCPDYYQIPRSTRKRILRFLCDNGWIDIS